MSGPTAPLNLTEADEINLDWTGARWSAGLGWPRKGTHRPDLEGSNHLEDPKPTPTTCSGGSWNGREVLYNTKSAFGILAYIGVVLEGKSR